MERKDCKSYAWAWAHTTVFILLALLLCWYVATVPGSALVTHSAVEADDPPMICIPGARALPVGIRLSSSMPSDLAMILRANSCSLHPALAKFFALCCLTVWATKTDYVSSRQADCAIPDASINP